MNKIKEIYILSAINLYKKSDDDYLCGGAPIVREKFNIDEKEYLAVIDRLEKQGSIIDEEKYYGDERVDLSYDGKKINHDELSKTLNDYKSLCNYNHNIDLSKIKPLADEIRKYYSDKNILDASATLFEGIFLHSTNTPEELLFYYLSAKDRAMNDKNGLIVLAQIFDVQYHNAEQLIKLPDGFFDTILTYFGVLLEEADYQLWYEKLPKYIKDKRIKEKDTNSYYFTKDRDTYFYRGRPLSNLSKDTDYYQVFSILFDVLPKGGYVEYSILEKKVKIKVLKTKNMARDEVRRFIQRNLTDEQNGFLTYEKIENEITEGKKLIKAVRGKGIDFNNKIE